MADEETKLETPEEESAVVENKKEKKSVWEWLQDHPKTVFLTRALVWAIFAAALPFAFIAFRYGIFHESNNIALSGWGLVGIVIVIVFAFSVFGYIKQGMAEGMFKQCLVGFMKIIIPLVAVLLVVEGIKNNIILFEKALGVVIVCEFVAIPINPFPAWLEKRRKEQKLEERESMMGAIIDKISTKKGKKKDK